MSPTGRSGNRNNWILGGRAALFAAMLSSGLLLTPLSLAQVRESARDWSGMSVYRSANSSAWSQKKGDRVVFFGDSITQGWDLDKSFPSAGYVNRGIGGQTTAQMLVRFRQDVIAINPQVVVILAGTNDIAENLGPTTLEEIENNLMSMVDIAERNGVRVVLSSILPAGQYPWRKEIQPIEKIVALNNWMAGYASGRGLVYVDYFSAMQNDKHWMKGDLSPDGIHPNAAGYAVMRTLAEPAIFEALQPRRRTLGYPTSSISADASGKTIIIPDKRDLEYEKYHYAPAIRLGDTVIVSGIPAAGAGTYQDKIRRMFQRVAVTLQAAGAGMDDVVEIQTFHANSKDTAEFQKEFEEILAVHREFFASNYPAWTAIGNAVLLANGAAVEIRVVAVIGASKNVHTQRPSKPNE